MPYVVMNVITVPEGRGADLEARFAARAAEVDKQPGFLGFELLRPHDGDRYIVYTKWASQDDFMAWMGSRAFGEGHRQHSEQGPVGTASEVWQYDVVLESKPSAPAS